MNEKKNCEDCVFLKTFLNQEEMRKQGKDESDVIWLYICDHSKTPGVVTDLSIAESCSYYDEDSWLK